MVREEQINPKLRRRDRGKRAATLCAAGCPGGSFTP